MLPLTPTTATPQTFGLPAARRLIVNAPAPVLYEEAVRRNEGIIGAGGPFVVETGKHTGRSPGDKFVVREPGSDAHIWWGPVNRPFDPARFAALRDRVLAYLQARAVFVQECAAGADPRYELPVRVITDTAWHALFARNLFRAPTGAVADPPSLRAPFTVISAPGFAAIPERDGTRSETFIIVNFAERLALIGGTGYAGEIKKTIFTVLNYLLPLEGVLSMHCSANVGAGGDVALFFGLSGTGKTSLSADPARALIGDDEHGWSASGVFNLEGGCYAKVIRLSPIAEPEIYRASTRFGTVLENVVVDPATRALRLDDESLTENTRAAYPLAFIENAKLDGRGSHPRAILLLTADAFGVMPPIARLTSAQARYHFLAGYTARVAGTERGLGSEPEATFSACFGAPFLVWHPTKYAQMLGDQMARHAAACWLVNTGWSGGPYGIGARINIAYTRAIVHAALSGQLDGVPTRRDPVFGLQVPVACPGVPAEVLDPRQSWADPLAYDRQARELARRFTAYFEQFAGEVDSDVRAAAPRAE